MLYTMIWNIYIVVQIIPDDHSSHIGDLKYRLKTQIVCTFNPLTGDKLMDTFEDYTEQIKNVIKLK